MITTAPHLYTIDEYLQLEETADEKHEFHAGELIPMPGGTANHSLIALYFAIYLKQALVMADRRDVKLFNSDMRLWLPEVGHFVYPDAMAVRSDLEYYNDRKTAIANPSLIVEVLSDSTEAYDRGEKFRRYQSIPSFTEYLLFDQKQRYVEQYIRRTDLEWTYRCVRGAESSLAIECLEVELMLGDIYEEAEL